MKYFVSIRDGQDKEHLRALLFEFDNEVFANEFAESSKGKAEIEVMIFKESDIRGCYEPTTVNWYDLHYNKIIPSKIYGYKKINMDFTRQVV